MLGAGDKIVATVLTPASVPWLYTIDPALRQAQTVFTNTTVNAEALAQTHPDVLFADKSTQIAAGGRNAAQISGNARPVSTEQVAQWNPDVIILASSAFAVADPGQQTLENLSTDSFWNHLAEAPLGLSDLELCGVTADLTRAGVAIEEETVRAAARGGYSRR